MNSDTRKLLEAVQQGAMSCLLYTSGAAAPEKAELTQGGINADKSKKEGVRRGARLPFWIKLLG